ncbi:MAG: hypothetical protein HW421_2258 [Ignavibacteria bacterium]|nr:hypothetical protein [Ignavibacteria bacterium]
MNRYLLFVDILFIIQANQNAGVPHFAERIDKQVRFLHGCAAVMGDQGFML